MRLKKYSRSLFLACAITVLSFLHGHTAHALAGVYNFANNGNYYTQYGPTNYWHRVNNEGYCGHMSNACSPSYMKYTYTSCPNPVNYAKWNNPNSAQYGTEYVFVPRVHATTTMAPYSISYNGASSYSYTLNQLAYSDVWVSARRLYDIRATWLDDNTCEASTKKIGFDEIRIVY